MSPVVIVTGGYDFKIRFWDASSGQCTRVVTFGESQINCLQISQDKSLLAAGGNPLVQLFDINNTSEDKPIYTYDGHSNNVTAVGFQQDQRWIYSGSEDGTIRIWDPRTNNTGRKFDCGSAINTVALHPNEMELISGDQSGAIRIWDLQADKCRKIITPLVDIPIRSISIALDASMFTVGSHRGKLFVYNLSSNEEDINLLKEFQAHDDYLLKCTLSNDLKRLATSSADKTIKIWNTETWELERILNKHQRWVWDCVISADSAYLLSTSSDLSAKLWDLRSGDVIRNFSVSNNNLAFTCVALNDISLS